jgi:hypothetical protein
VLGGMGVAVLGGMGVAVLGGMGVAVLGGMGVAVLGGMGVAVLGKGDDGGRILLIITKHRVLIYNDDMFRRWR